MAGGRILYLDSIFKAAEREMFLKLAELRCDLHTGAAAGEVVVEQIGNCRRNYGLSLCAYGIGQ